MENRAKIRKNPISLGLEGEFLQFVPETLEHPLYTFLMTNLPLLSQKLATKLKKLLLDQFVDQSINFRSISTVEVVQYSGGKHQYMWG